MKRNTKYLWLYTAILFSFALILITFAYFTQSNIISETKEIHDSNLSMMEKSVTQLTSENTNLRNELSKKSKLLEEQSAIIETYKEKEKEMIVEKETDEKFVMAYESYKSGKKREAKSMIQSYSRDKLTHIQQKIYDIINN